ncbi:glycerate kinase [Pseudomonas asuensis]|uniref:Glycerate kinase n=1 Tax=Pseudomonas asuensis TaxID=1825787 RepID=A0ABQ2GQ43_9PSED|nr:glycerate kinase [Pseudomonas asuensis]GGM07418.1 hypothetical protein GCM10009425_18350 [Pseudomonas asuensis]
MKLVIAPDSFKESLSAPEVAQAIAEGWREVFPSAAIELKPMADGGEGTVDALLAATGGQRREMTVQGPLGQPVPAHWGWLEDDTAVIEMAAASGLHWVPKGQRDVKRASSYGTGELIKAALDEGARRIILGLGGSATNDGGTGLLSALGVQFLDEHDQPLMPGGAALASLTRIDLSQLDRRLATVRIEVAADVNNPLCGIHGASHIFGPQKGATPDDVAVLDAALGHYAQVVACALSEDHRNFPGAGAAGGLGFAAKAFLNARFRPGIELVAEILGLAEAIRGADLVITGEGQLDHQSLHGKTPVGVAKIAREAGVPVVALVGSLGERYQQVYDSGIEAAFSLAPGPITLERACQTAAQELRARSTDLARFWRLARQSR